MSRYFVTMNRLAGEKIHHLQSQPFQFWRVCLPVIAVLCAGAYGQAPLLNSVNDQTQTPIAGVGHDYQHLLGETINFSNGSVSFKISFPVAKGRGITLPFVWSYNSASVNPVDSVDGSTPVWDNPSSHLWPQKDGWNLAEGIPTATVQVWSVNGNGVNPFTGVVETGATFIPCNFQSGMTFTGTDGVLHNLYSGAIAPAFINNTGGDAYTCPGGGTSNTTSPTGDGQVVATLDPLTASQYLLSNSPASGDFTVMDKNGVVYAFPGGVTSSNFGPLYAGSVTDRNGNTISLQTNTDTVGHSLPTETSPSGTGTSTVVVTADNLTYTSTWTTENISYAISVAGKPGSGTGIGCQGIPTTVSGTRNILSSLVLPNNQFYTFYYGNNNPTDSSVLNPYGLLNEVIFPDGGWIKYTWQLPAQGNPGADSQYNEMASLGGFSESSYGGVDIYTPQPYGCVSQYQTPVLASRIVSFDGVTVAQKQSLSFGTTWQYASDGTVNGWSAKTATVTTTDQLRGAAASKTVYTYGPSVVTNGPFANDTVAPAIPLENTITYYDWGQTTKLKTVTKQWLDQFNLASEITTIYSAGGASRVSGTVYKYQSGYCNNVLFPYGSITENPVGSLIYLKEEDNYDFGNGSLGPLTKKTLYNYSCFQSATVPPQISSVTIEDGNGNIKAATQYGYDAPGSLTSASALQHVASYGTGMTVRGNVTSLIKCSSLPASPTSACSGPTTNYAYDITGQPTSVQEPSAVQGQTYNTTYFSFIDNYIDQSSAPSTNTNAYLTNITYPDGLQKSFQYSYGFGGYLTAATDENRQQITYAYNTNAGCSGTRDGMNRLGEVDYPDTGWTKYCYNDPALTVTKYTLLDTAQDQMENITQFDGMGHAILSELQSDPDGATLVNTAYDGEGAAFTVSNPHRSTSSSSDGTTYQYYDALGRKVETKEQDGSILQWCYNGLGSSIAPVSTTCNNQLGSVASSAHPGTWVDFTDERGSTWQRTSDVFGNLTEVMEPNGASQSPSMETDYAYDTLNNLLMVSQFGGAHGSSGARKRTFFYDNLSELVTASNPETGTVGYSYYPNGEVQSRTDARGIQTQYGYDSMNRLLSKIYSNDPSGTPASCYQYGNTSDTTNFTGGRLINAWTQTAQSCPSSPSSYLTLRSIQMYDQLGRLKGEQQFTLASQATGKIYKPQYAYNLAGILTSSTDGTTPSPTTPGTPLTFTYTIGGAGRAQIVTSNWADGTHPAQLFSQSNSQSTTCANASSWQYSPFGGLMNASFGAGLTLNKTYDVRLRTTCELDLGTGTTPATPGTTTVTITGSEQSK